MAGEYQDQWGIWHNADGSILQGAPPSGKTSPDTGAPGSIRQNPDDPNIWEKWNGSTWVADAALSKYINGTTGGGGAGNYHLDPRELALEYAKLQESLTAQQMADLKDLIENRNTESVGLANAYTSAADKAANFAANPRDAVADLMYRKAVGLNGQGATPFGSTANDQFGQYGNALADKFQALFGPSADALKRAGEFIGQIPPSEYLSPPSATAGAGGAGGGGGGGAGNPPTPVDITPNPNATNPETGPTPYSGMPGGTPTHLSKGGTIGIHPMMPGGGYRVGASSSEGGTNMNVHEPAMVVGKSGHVYATIAENAPEQLIVKPLPSVQKYQKDQQAQNAAFLKSTVGATRNDTGGGITFGTDPSQFMDQLRQMFSLRGLLTGPKQALPDPRLLAGDVGQDILRDPEMSDYVAAGYSGLGISPKELDYTISRFRPAGIRPSLPKVMF